MALVGKWTKIEQVVSETETQLITREYPSAEIMGEDHTDIDKAGTTEEIEVAVVKEEETIYNDVYVVVYSINCFKNRIYEGSERNQMNICWKVYEDKETSISDPFNFIHEDHLIQKSADLSESNQSLTEQAYGYLKNTRGFEELIND